jgi:4-azaleucine resistance transporter AzlC
LNDAAPAPASAARASFADGARAGMPVVLGYLSIGFAAGVVERAAGLSIAEVALLSLVLYAGSAQFVVAGMVAAASPALTVIVTVFFVNLRHLLLSAALAPALRGLPAWRNALVGAQLTDETFVIAWSRLAGGGVLTAPWMWGLNLSAYLAWASANVAGAGLGAALGDSRRLGFDFALTAMFAALLVLQLQANPARARALVVALVAAVLAVTLSQVLPGTWFVIVATLAAATAGLMLERWSARRS